VGHKTIVIRALRTPATAKAFTYSLLPLRWIKHPGPRLPWRLMAQMLSVAAGKHGNPVPILVLTKLKECRVLQSGPSVRVAFAFGRLLG
jgi:hypothetical protein